MCCIVFFFWQFETKDKKSNESANKEIPLNLYMQYI